MLITEDKKKAPKPTQYKKKSPKPTQVEEKQKGVSNSGLQPNKCKEIEKEDFQRKT